MKGSLTLGAFIAAATMPVTLGIQAGKGQLKGQVAGVSDKMRLAQVNHRRENSKGMTQSLRQATRQLVKEPGRGVCERIAFENPYGNR